MLVLTELSEASTLDDDVETLLELAFTAVSAWSMLDEEFDRLKLDVWLVDMLALAVFSTASMLEDDREKVFELALIAPSNASILDEEFERLRLDT